MTQASALRHAQFAILGAGALGSILGAHLARAGHAVVMLARERRARQIERDGLHLTGLTDFSVGVPVLDDPAALASAAVLIVAMKTPGTAAALAPLYRADIPVAFSIQNGLMKNDILAAAFGRERVLGALADLSGELGPDGTVRFTRNVGLYLGELDGECSARAQEIARAIDSAGVRALATRDVLNLEWSKFCAWVGLMALSVTTRALTWQYLTDPDSALLVVRLVREMGLLAQAAGARLEDRAVLPVATICGESEARALQVVRQAGRVFEASAPTHRMSALQDLAAGRALEVEETLGFALEKARQLGVQLPLLEVFYPLIAAINRSRRAVP